MKNIKLLLGLLVPVSVLAADVDFDAIKAGRVKAALTIKTMDDSGSVVTGSTVKIWFKRWNDEPDFSEGVTDSNGLFSAEGRSYWGDVVFRVEKDGYYQTSGKHQFANTQIQNNRFQPWNPVSTQILRKIINPVSLYVQRINLELPPYNERWGYDLMVGDWISPHGEGEISDLIIKPTIERRGRDDFDYKLEVTFSNPKDGIQESPDMITAPSQLKSNQFAPVENYASRWVQKISRMPEEGEISNRDYNRIYYFRVRTKTNAKGDITEAIYGKIYGDFLQFTYYLNPVINDRSMEFNGQNLFKDEKRKFDP